MHPKTDTFSFLTNKMITIILFYAVEKNFKFGQNMKI